MIATATKAGVATAGRDADAARAGARTAAEAEDRAAARRPPAVEPGPADMERHGKTTDRHEQEDARGDRGSNNHRARQDIAALCRPQRGANLL